MRSQWKNLQYTLRQHKCTNKNKKLLRYNVVQTIQLLLKIVFKQKEYFILDALNKNKRGALELISVFYIEPREHLQNMCSTPESISGMCPRGKLC